MKYPDDDDLDGAAIGLLRLQDTYQLKTADLANGFIQGQQVGSGLTAQDCFEVGRAAYNGKDYYHTLQWMEEALERIKVGDVLNVLVSYLCHKFTVKVLHID